MVVEKKKLMQMFLHEKPAELLIRLKGEKKYASILAKEVDCTYSHCVRILQEMKKIGLVDFEKRGRIKLISLTKIGEDVAFAMENVVRVFSKP